MTFGILIIALGYDLYGNSAYNLALSLKAYDDKIKVCLLHDNKATAHLTSQELGYFDSMVVCDPLDYANGQYQRTKLCAYKYSPFDFTIYLDADSIWLPGKTPSQFIGECLHDQFRIGMYGYFNSYFAPYTAFGNEAICRFTDWQATMVNAAFPFIEEFQTECEVTDIPVDKSSNTPDSTEEKYSGKKYKYTAFSKGPHGRTVRKAWSPETAKNNPFAEQGLDPSIPSIRFIQANPDTAKYAEESWKGLIIMAEDALHLNLGRGLLSGTAKEIDLEPKNTMISKIGNNVFDNIMLSSIIYVDAYYNYSVANHEEVSIDKPTTFSIKTESDILNEITVLKEKNAPDFFLRASSLDLAKKRFSGDRVNQKFFNIMSETDPLFTYSSAEKRDMLMAGGITKRDYILNINISFFMHSIAAEVGIDAFLNMETDKIQEMIEARLEEYLPEAPTVIVE